MSPEENMLKFYKISESYEEIFGITTEQSRKMPEMTQGIITWVSYGNIAMRIFQFI